MQRSSKLPSTAAGTGAGAASTPQTRPPPVQQMGGAQHSSQAAPGMAMGYPQQQGTAPTMPAMEEPLKPARNQYPSQPAGNYQ